MRHKVYGKHLGRDKNAREALFKNLVHSLILWEKIETTETKAKAIKGLVDKIINNAKSPNTRRLVSQFLIDKKVQEKLIQEFLPRLKSRTSGYTSVTKLGKRLGDGSKMVQIRLLLESRDGSPDANPAKGGTQKSRKKPKTKKGDPPTPL